MTVSKDSQFRRFLILWGGELISSIGTGMTAFGLSVYVFLLTSQATAVALVALCAFLPMILISPFAGVLADRYDRRLLMILGDGGSAVGLILLLILHQIDLLTVPIILVVTVISSMFSGLLGPAYKATITDMLSQEAYSKASGLVQLAGAAKYLISPFLAGIVLRFADIDWILAVDILTVMVTISTILMVRKGMKSMERKASEQQLVIALKEGMEQIWDQPMVRLLVKVMALVTFFIGFIQTLYTPMMLSLADTYTLGVIESVSAVGLLISSLYMGMKTLKKSHFKMLAWGLVVMGICIICMGLTDNVFIIGSFGFLMFVTLPFINTPADVLIRTNIPNDVQGRAWGLIGIITQLGYVAAYAVSGLLADYVFNPMLLPTGALADSVGRIIGTGPARGIGLMLMLSGMSVVFVGIVLVYKKDESQKEVMACIEKS